MAAMRRATGRVVADCESSSPTPEAPPLAPAAALSLPPLDLVRFGAPLYRRLRSEMKRKAPGGGVPSHAQRLNYDDFNEAKRSDVE